MKRTRSQGFTLIEMLIVVMIVGLLAGVAVGQYRRAMRKSHEALLRENLYVMRSQIHTYLGAEGHYPFDLKALVDAGYLRNIPVDPITKSSETWVTYASAPTDEDLDYEVGIEDVFSGAEGVGLDGTEYAGW